MTEKNSTLQENITDYQQTIDNLENQLIALQTKNSKLAEASNTMEKKAIHASRHYNTLSTILRSTIGENACQ